MNDILRTMLFLDEGATILTVDTIEHAGEWWLVTGWNKDLARGIQQPARMIALAPLNPKPSKFAGHDWAVWTPVSKALLHGPGLPDKASGFRVLILPDLWIETPRLH